MTETPPAPFDAALLIADIRKGDPEAMKRACKLTFGHDMGRLVLAHFMALCGVGNALGAAASAGEMRYQAGRHDAALELASLAGFDQASIVAAVLTDELEGNTDDRSFNYAADGNDHIDDY